ncbi:5-formyltetrahydrofolate cyclo-ligase [Oceaniglobus trochenteri]|uniref:5-formyltetrahydrofolate cyclo-ligase n=1 Tax=Oceaniglobus trochenteri TaxID=2763260 RepID=UPI001CFFA6CD|nr:5-formyltetrahydrofolate cyclo-ligase [Oceaniglobus trochenteri]
MTKNTQQQTERAFASSPCASPDLADPEQARDVARWRKAERSRLRAARLDMTVASRQDKGADMARHLDDLLQDRFDGAHGLTVSFYWPIKGEPNLRALMVQLHEQGVQIALPLVETRAAPLVFRRWTPETRMVHGDWNIPVPPPEAEQVTPDITLAPLVGWDDEGYRLGYGGGYFDRTLAALSPRPVTIGIGFESARLATIFPQPHDISLDFILTEAGLRIAKDTR